MQNHACTSMCHKTDDVCQERDSKNDDEKLNAGKKKKHLSSSPIKSAFLK